MDLGLRLLLVLFFVGYIVCHASVHVCMSNNNMNMKKGVWITWEGTREWKRIEGKKKTSKQEKRKEKRNILGGGGIFKRKGHKSSKNTTFHSSFSNSFQKCQLFISFSLIHCPCNLHQKTDSETGPAKPHRRAQ